jgi:hypothetical protein
MMHHKDGSHAGMDISPDAQLDVNMTANPSGHLGMDMAAHPSGHEGVCFKILGRFEVRVERLIELPDSCFFLRNLSKLSIVKST